MNARVLSSIVLSGIALAGAAGQTLPLRATHSASFASDFMGYAVSRLGDVNGDAVPDYLVGVHGTNSAGGPLTGQALVVSGATRQNLYILNGVGAADRFGYSLDCGRDVNGDGVPDFIIGAPSTFLLGGTAQGTVYVYSGATGANLFTINAAGFDALGFDVALIGDVNGDGRSEFAASEGFFWNNNTALPNRVYIYDGASGAVLRTFSAPATGTTFGVSIAGTGDVDGDQAGDIVIGYPNWTSTGGVVNGRAEVYSGATGASIYDLTYATANTLYGISVASGGDMNGDGRPEIVVGGAGYYAPFYLAGLSTSTGVVGVHDGQTGGLLFQYNPSIFDFGLTSGTGFSVAGGEDLNGDGVPDFLAGAPGAYLGTLGISPGAVLALSGANGQVLRRINGDQQYQNFAQSVALLADQNGDGFAEILSGSPSFDLGALTDAGGAFVHTLTGSNAFGTALNGLSLQYANGPGTLGAVVSNGASAGAGGFIAANFIAGSTSFGVPPIPVYVAIDPALLISTIGYDGTGSWSQPFDIRQPTLSGVVIYLQAFSATNGIASASNGLEILFL